MPTVVRALLDRDPPPTLLMLWRARDILAPPLGPLLVGVVLLISRGSIATPARHSL